MFREHCNLHKTSLNIFAVGFWSNLVKSASEVGHWAANNSGSILKAAQLFAEIAGVAAIEHELLAEDDNLLVAIHDHVKKAENAMITCANANFPAPQTLPGSSSMISGPYDLPGLWPEPPVASEPKPQPSVTTDIGKFLALNKLPNVLGKGDIIVNVGETIASRIFVPAPAQSSEDSLTSVELSGVSTKDGTKITGGHVYYQIPLDNARYQAAWHSLLRLWFQTLQKTLEDWKDEKKSLRVKPRQSIIAVGDAYNSTTISVE